MVTHDLLQHLSRSTDAILAAVADNCRFDERTSASRWQQFEDILLSIVADPSAIDSSDWAEANKLNLEQYCNVSSLTVPDAFLGDNRGAWLDRSANHQSVVRIEALTRPLKAGKGFELEELDVLLQRSDTGRDYDARRAVEDFFEDWNQSRDARPIFAAFYDEVKDECDTDDWPHALRDRLGLGHYGYNGGAPVPVALMQYSLTEVIAKQIAQRLPVACALPTVLDGGMHEFFFPVPRDHPYGATLHLGPGQAEILTAEIIHCRIDYRRDHLVRLGWIERPHEVRDDRLREARDLHLLALQLECDREDFGEPMVGRI